MKKPIQAATRTASKLAPPWPSSPGRPPYCEVQITCAERDMLQVHSFGAAYSAKKFIDALIGDDEYNEINEKVIKTDKGIKIKSTRMTDILAHKYTDLEDEFELPQPYVRIVQLFRGEGYKRSNDDAPSIHDQGVPRPKSSSPAPSPKADKPERKAEKPTGMVTIQDLCAELKIDPSKARAALRKSNTPKPDHGWAWAKADVEAIKKIVRNAK